MQRNRKPASTVATLGMLSALLVGCGEAPPESPAPVQAAEEPAVQATATRPPLATPKPAQGAGETPAPEAPAPPVAGETYVVEPGDTLNEISNRFYGEHAHWDRIYEANRDVIGDDPDQLQVGMELIIPPPRED